jgi:hypothetical protein
VRQEGGSAQDPFGKIMALWTFDVKFPCGTQFTFGSLTFAVGEDRNLKMMPLGPAPERHAQLYGQTSYFPAISSTTGGASSGLDPYAEQHIRTVKVVRVFQSECPSFSHRLGHRARPHRQRPPIKIQHYPEIGGSTCGDPAEEGRLIIMVAPARGPS